MTCHPERSEGSAFLRAPRPTQFLTTPSNLYSPAGIYSFEGFNTRIRSRGIAPGDKEAGCPLLLAIEIGSLEEDCGSAAAVLTTRSNALISYFEGRLEHGVGSTRSSGPKQNHSGQNRLDYLGANRLALVHLGRGGSAYAFWALWRFTHVPLLLLVAVWAIVFDETHGFATISRTYFDAEERARRGRWLWGSLAFFFTVGPVLILLHLGDWLELATELWGYYHIFKQHYGFMMMYKKKNRDFGPMDMRLDQVAFAVAFYYPFLTYPLHSREAAELLPSLSPLGSAHLPVTC